MHLKGGDAFQYQFMQQGDSHAQVPQGTNGELLHTGTEAPPQHGCASQGVFLDCTTLDLLIATPAKKIYHEGN